MLEAMKRRLAPVPKVRHRFVKSLVFVAVDEAQLWRPPVERRPLQLGVFPMFLVFMCFLFWFALPTKFRAVEGKLRGHFEQWLPAGGGAVHPSSRLDVIRLVLSQLRLQQTHRNEHLTMQKAHCYDHLMQSDDFLLHRMVALEKTANLWAEQCRFHSHDAGKGRDNQ